MNTPSRHHLNTPSIRAPGVPAPPSTRRKTSSLSNTTNTEPIPPISNSNPYYLEGKTAYSQEPFHFRKTYRRLHQELATPIPVNSTTTTWALAHRLLTSTRNHEAIVLEHNGRQTLVIVLGRYGRTMQWIDLETGQQYQTLTTGTDPANNPLNDLNHVASVVLDNPLTGQKEMWLPCGFHNDKVGKEKSSAYVRIVNLDTMQVRTGPKLPIAGGACTALALQLIPGDPPSVCTFGGTHGNHNTGTFLKYASCYDGTRQKWYFPFGALPYGLDHGSLAHVPAAVCHPDDPARILLFNYRKRAFDNLDATEMLAYDLPKNGWTLEELERTDKEALGPWYVYANITNTGLGDDLNAPRDAAGLAMANGGRHFVNFGGVSCGYDDFETKTNFQRNDHSMIRMLDVCEKTWQKVGDLGVDIFAIQSAASSQLNMVFTCGGEGRYQGKSKCAGVGMGVENDIETS